MEDSIIKFILDVGNSKIKMLAGELSNYGEKLRVLKYVEVPSRGIRKNVIENQIYLSESIADAVREMETATGLEVKKVILGIGGTNIYSRTKNIRLSFDEEKVITNSHITELFLTVEKELKQKSEQVLESEMYNIRVNNSGIVKNPVGLTGRELQADVHLIFVNETEVEELTEAVNRAKLEVDSIVLNPYASAKATLMEEDKTMGVALIDIGEGTTDIIIYKNNKLIYAKSLPLGGMHYVSDLEYIFSIPKSDAQEIIRQIGELKDKQDFNFPVNGNKYISIGNIRKVIDARTGDLVTFIKKTIEESGFTGYLGKGIYLTGGATKMDEIFEGVKSNLGYSVKRVLPVQLAGLEDVKPEMSAVVGILLEVMEKEYNKMEKERKKKEEQENLLKESIKINEEKAEEKPKVKKERFKSVKEWLSNFI